MSSEPWKLSPVNMYQSELQGHISQQGIDKLTSLLGQSVETSSFIISADRAVGLYLELIQLEKDDKEDRLSDAALTNPRNGIYTKASKCSDNLHKAISAIPERYWRQIEYHLELSQDGSTSQLDLLQLLNDFTIATDEAIRDYRPIRAGVERKTANWALIESLAQAFAQYFPKPELSEAKSGYFYKAMKIVFECGKVSINEPRDIIRSYLRNSTWFQENRGEML